MIEMLSRRVQGAVLPAALLVGLGVWSCASAILYPLGYGEIFSRF